MFFAWLLRFILIYWLISVVFRWMKGSGQPGKKSQAPSGENPSKSSVSGVPYESDIEDADFEEIDGRES